jgi:excisionase family DNA binding protein
MDSVAATALSDDSRPVEKRRRQRRALVGRRIYDLATHEDAWVSPEQIATYYGVSEKTVRRKWIDPGLLEAHRFPGSHVRVNVVTLRAFEQRHAITPQPV